MITRHSGLHLMVILYLLLLTLWVAGIVRLGTFRHSYTLKRCNIPQALHKKCWRGVRLQLGMRSLHNCCSGVQSLHDSKPQLAKISCCGVNDKSEACISVKLRVRSRRLCIYICLKIWSESNRACSHHFVCLLV
jgi:hypothetical protein